ncbi:MAG TPA: Rod shape-determining protein MreD, partial [Cyclobacteriaceae bacterium]|nr:Rod shape-determining protein MreD [Cyclobacteriaceae bacterium]
LAANGLQWFLVYALPLIFVHQFILFFLEAGGFSLLGYTLLKIFMSTFFTLSVIIMTQYLIPQGRRI